ncbi:class E vacuolar protein-sorting machinery protein HSE1 [Kwoniella mangroviensis CBS 10435]|uniref:Class E vacuolar protein-sorting machinery protein HSE1 n=1 Tax=Kwoniella mangroviensis CBS 10435 TaxID=1331196 RepID=A0A1B9IKW8_9TREE|nr:class E vacuolar protein-sorting machinery protein HSE1 [Kwoniella mangroviensis CBS 10435]
MFSTATNPYDELIVKATDENLASEDWALNIEVCDKVSGEGENGARQAVAALTKRLSHRNPNVQLYALELANTLAQNCGKELYGELSSRGWTGALDRLVNDRTTAAPVKKKALSYIKSWAKQFEDTGDPNLGIMGELYDQLRAKNFNFDEAEPQHEDAAEARQRQEDEELQRVLELSKQDKGGRTSYNYQPSNPSAGGSSSSAPNHNVGGSSSSSSRPYQQQQQQQYQAPQPVYNPPAPQPEPEQPLDINTATRVRALYTFTSAEVGELNFERGDYIKVLDRGFKEWWRGACNGKIGIFPVTYVEAVPEPSPRELQEEAQEEARVFASLGLVDQLLQTLKGIDPSRGDRIDDRPEIEEMYQASVGLQEQINSLIKKYSDQKAELEHMNANFLRAIRQYEELRNPAPPPAAYGYAPQQPSQADPYAQGGYQQYPQQQAPPRQQAPAQSFPQQQPYAPQGQGQPQYSPQPHPQSQYNPEPQPQSQTQGYPQQSPDGHYGSAPPQAFPQAQPAPAVAPVEQQPQLGQYYQQRAVSSSSVNRIPSGAASIPGLPLPPTEPIRQNTEPGVAGLGAGSDPQAEHKKAWDDYYRQQAQNQLSHPQSLAPGQGGQPQGYAPQAHDDPHTQNVYGQSPYAPAQGQGIDGVTQGINRMSVHGA